MNAPVDAAALARVSLDDKYTLDKGRVFLTGTQALVRNLTSAEIIAQVLVARDRLGDFPGGAAPTDGLVPSGEGVRGASCVRRYSGLAQTTRRLGASLRAASEESSSSPMRIAKS